MKPIAPSELETDPRFPSGPWTGYFLQPVVPGRHLMELHLTFQQGQMKGEGRDYVGAFIVRGQYSLVDGKCYWTKRYLGKHDVFYQGYNEGKGIWGVWEIPASRENVGLRGGFRIWPEGMSDPTQSHLTEQAEIPIPAGEPVESGERVAEPVGGRLQCATGWPPSPTSRCMRFPMGGQPVALSHQRAAMGGQAVALSQ